MPKQHGLIVLERLEQHGYEAYFVGGCVRDWLLKRPVHDIDICTNAHPGDVMRIFPDHIPTGLKHGTVSVKQGPYIYEVTTFRSEGKYLDYRRPEEVTFVSDIITDLSRRDFTINAMAMDRRERLIDPFAGQADAIQGIIRAVGEPEQRFREDALRMLRAVRFTAQLGFRIEPVTHAAISELASLLKKIAIERIRDELRKLLDSDYPQTGMEMIVQTSLCREFPALQEIWRKSLPYANRLGQLENYLQKWSMVLIAGEADIEQTNYLTSQLKFSRREKKSVTTLVQLISQLNPSWDQPAPVDWSRLVLQYGWETCREAAAILEAVWSCAAQTCHPVQDLTQAYYQLPVKTLQQLAITGSQLQQAFRRKPGSWISDVLQSLLIQTALHGLPNTPKSLLAAAEKEVLAIESDQTDDLNHI